MKVLIVEDNEDNRNLLMKQFTSCGFEPTAAVNGVEALALALAQPPDIIISDILMPEMDGFQLCRKCKTNGQLKNVPFVFYTATYTSGEDRKLALSLGADAFIIKPADPDVLARTLSEIVEKHKKGAVASSGIAPLETSPFQDEYSDRIRVKLDKKVADLTAEIIQHKQAEESLQQYKSIVFSSNDMMALINCDMIYLAANDAYLNAFGKARDEVIGHSGFEIFGKRFFETVIKSNAERCIAGHEVHYSEWFEFPDSGRRYMDVAYSPYYEFDNKIIGFVVISRDITPRKLVEDERNKLIHDTRERNKELQGLYNVAKAINECMSLEDLFKRISELLQPAWQYPEITRARLIFDGKEYSSAPFEPTQWKMTADIVVGGKSSGALEVYYLEELSDINEGPFLAEELNLINGIAQMLETAIERKQTEERRAVLEEKLRQSEKMEVLGQLAGGVAHDFNNQLSAIMGFAEMLRPNLADDELHEFAENIITSCKRSRDLTMQMLAFARKGKYQIDTVNVHEIVREVITFLGRSIDKQINIRQHLKANPSTIQGDETQIQNALLNVTINARDAMPEGGDIVFETSVVELDKKNCDTLKSNVSPGRYLLLSISDQGVGMDEETVKHAFEPFFTTKRIGKGTGMGLAAVYGTVENHGGAVSLESEADKGTLMKIYLPLVEEDSLIQKTKDRIAKPEKAATGSILMVDDEEMVLKMCDQMLRRMGYKVTTSMNGKEAIEYYRKSWKQIDVVILDMVMPELGGLDMFIAMREINPEIKAVLSSGYSLDGPAQEILNEGVKGFIQKPFTMKTLRAVLAKLLGR